jgi:hypothetical protein
MAKTAILVGIISLIMIQSVSGASEIQHNQLDDVENADAQECIGSTIYGRLEIKGSATNLDDLDGWTAGQSDPYMEVTATDEKGGTQTMKTPTEGGTNNPTWGDYLVFDNTVSWKKITIRIMDDDGAGRQADPLCPTQEIELKPGEQTISFDCNPGKTTIEYKLSSRSLS